MLGAIFDKWWSQSESKINSVFNYFIWHIYFMQSAFLKLHNVIVFNKIVQEVICC